MVSEDFSLMLEQRPGAYIQIGNSDGVRGPAGCTTPATISTTPILPLGASLFARLAEKKLARG